MDIPVNAAKIFNAHPEYRIGLLSGFFTFNHFKTESKFISRKRATANHPVLVMDNQRIQEADSHIHLGFVLVMNNQQIQEVESHKQFELVFSKNGT